MQTSLFGSETKPSSKKTPTRKRGVVKKRTTVPKLMATEPMVADSPKDPIGINDELEKILGVGEYLDYINHILKVTEDVKVQGEISRLSPHPTGVYMTLKDKDGEGVLDCYINPYTFQGLGIQLEEGMEVKLTGTPGIFKRRSQLSFKVENVELTGEGSLKKAYELLKAKLEQEGLFDRKRELPEFIHSIGVITSKTGAVIDDFRHNLEKRGFKLYFKDCRVEGAQSVSQISAAIKNFNINYPDLDCLVVMRGGGSLEDMQAFNNEGIVKEVFASRIPVIAAIGHDRDVPLACLAADKFTSTPTAAAVLINSSWARLQTELPELQNSLTQQFENALHSQRNRLANITHKLTGSFNAIFQRFRYLSEKILRGAGQVETGVIEIKQRAISTLNHSLVALERQLQKYGEQVVSAGKLLATANPERNLKLGYSLAYNSAGKIIRSASSVAKGSHIKVQLHKGSMDAEIINIEQ